MDLTPLLPADAPASQINSLGEHGGGTHDMLMRTQPHWALAEAWELDACRFDGLDIVLTFHEDRKNRGKLKFFSPSAPRGSCVRNSTTGQ